jgi:hypothetical protein
LPDGELVRALQGDGVALVAARTMVPQVHSISNLPIERSEIAVNNVAR